MKPKEALDTLFAGNARFVAGTPLVRDHRQSVEQTATQQTPFATVISCIDSRSIPELIFDQGIGDILSIRVAGNVVNNDIVGSLEFGVKTLGSKVICVMGHTECAAVTAAAQGSASGHIAHVLTRIREAAPEGCSVEELIRANVHSQIKRILSSSKILKKMHDDNSLLIQGAIYNIKTGQVELI